MKSITVVLTTAFLCSVSHAQTAKPDPRVQQELERVVAAYKAVGDFSISSREAYQGVVNGVPILATARLGHDGRLALREENLSKSPTGDVIGLTSNVNDDEALKKEVARDHWEYVANRTAITSNDLWKARYSLFDGKQFITSTDGIPETRIKTNKIDGQKFFERSTGLVQLDLILNRHRFFSTGTHLEKSPFTFKSLEGRRSLIGLHLTEAGVTSNHKLTIGASGYLEKYEVDSNLQGKIVFPEIVCAFSRPLPLKIAEPFNWNKFTPHSKFHITPASRAVMERAAKFYGGLKSYSVTFKSFKKRGDDGDTIDENVVRHFDWVRGKSFRLIEPNERKRTVFVDNVIYIRDNGYLEVRRDNPTYPSSSEQIARFYVPIAEEDEFMGELLSGETPVLNILDRFSSLKSKSKGNQRLGKILCDVVEFEGHEKGGDESETVNRKYTFWFAHDDGRLLRLQTDGADILGNGLVDDTQLEAQRLNPVFAAGTFGKLSGK